MKKYKITDTRQNLCGIASGVNVAYGPVKIINTKNGNNVILLSERYWNDIIETLNLSAIPGFSESIIKGKNESIKDCVPYVEGEKW